MQGLTTFRIHLPRTVRGDWPIGHHLVAPAGWHTATANQRGAISVVFPDGQLLGIKPEEWDEIVRGEDECQSS